MGKSTKRPGPTGEIRLTELDQLRALADPLRMRILEVLCEGEFTTKQVADRLGEPPTRLYHHVETLRRTGLVKLARTRRNRGTLEKYFVAIAHRFSVDSELLRPGDASTELGAGVRSFFARTADEVSTLLDDPAAAASLDERAVISFAEVRGTPAEMKRIRRRLERLLESLVSDEVPGSPDAHTERYRLTLAWFPLPRDPGPG